MSWSLIWHLTWKELVLLLKAPLLEPNMLWMLAPLLFTFLVMTFYFGLYRREELGWNTALGNMIVLLFVSIDLLKTIYNYSMPPSLYNFVLHPIKLLVIFIIVVEAILLFYFAFTHLLPKKIMFFLASPAEVNIQAYVITAIIYLRRDPNKYTLLAALLLFVIILITTKVLQIVERLLVEKKHGEKVEKIIVLRKETKMLKRKAGKLKGKKAEELIRQAEEKTKLAKKLEKSVKESERKQHGKLTSAKKLKK